MVILETIFPSEDEYHYEGSPAERANFDLLVFVYLFGSFLSIILLKLWYDDKINVEDDGVDVCSQLPFKKRCFGIIFFCCLCFLTRSTVIFVTFFNQIDPFGVKDIFYYTFLEIIPIAVLMYNTNDFHDNVQGSLDTKKVYQKNDQKNETTPILQ
ncbi:hypothetical protein ACTA71_006867 [Dictyostelium dimigraforme]